MTVTDDELAASVAELAQMRAYVRNCRPAPLPAILGPAEQAAPVVIPAGAAGAPHPSPFLASRGWETGITGVWERRNGAGNDA